MSIYSDGVSSVGKRALLLSMIWNDAYPILVWVDLGAQKSALGMPHEPCQPS